MTNIKDYKRDWPSDMDRIINALESIAKSLDKINNKLRRDDR
jgi:uncharacterized protein YukE